MEQRKIEYTTVQVDSLEPHPKNVRQGDIGAISESLKTHGQYRPIVVDRRTNRILAGNHTWKAAKALGWQQISAGFIETKDDDEALRILLADNKANDLATYDDTELINLLKDLAATDEGLEGTLFDGDELDALIAENEHFELPADVDEIPEQVPTISKLGDVWLLGEHRVMCGDSTDAKNVAELMNGVKPDIVLTDPPYGMFLDTDWSDIQGSLKSVGAKSKTVGKKYNKVIGDNEDFTPELITTLFNNFISAKEMFIFGADYFAELLPDKNNGSWLVWDKRKPSQEDAIGAEFELIWSKTKHKRRVLRHDWFGFLSSSNPLEARNRVHPTQKPTSLLIDILSQWSNNLDTVVDLYGGSGSTLIAAHETNRVAYLMELDPHYVDVICARYQKHTGNQPILEATGKPHDFNADH